MYTHFYLNIQLISLHLTCIIYILNRREKEDRHRSCDISHIFDKLAEQRTCMRKYNAFVKTYNSAEPTQGRKTS